MKLAWLLTLPQIYPGELLPRSPRVARAGEVINVGLAEASGVSKYLKLLYVR
jgi:hypothetical protein